MENWRGFLKNPKFIFTHSPFSPIHLFFNFPKQGNSYFFSFHSRSALIRVYLRQKNPLLFSVFFVSSDFSPFFFHTAKLLQIFVFSQNSGGELPFRPKREILFPLKGRSLTFVRDDIFTMVHIALSRIIDKIQILLPWAEVVLGPSPFKEARRWYDSGPEVWKRSFLKSPQPVVLRVPLRG